MSVVRAFNYKILPTAKQHTELASILDDQRSLYNAALEERISFYKVTGKYRNYMDQCKALTEWRKSDPYGRKYPANLQRWTLKHMEVSFTKFFDRVSSGKGKAGFPRFKSSKRWSTFGFREFSGIMLEGNRLTFKGMPGSLRVHMHRPLPVNADIRSCLFTRNVNGWFVSFHVSLEINNLPETGNAVGVDVGLRSLATLSDGSIIPNIRPAKLTEKEMRKRQRAVSRCKRNSNRRRKICRRAAKCHAKTTNIRRTYLHQVSSVLVRDNDLIAMEKLNIHGLVMGLLPRAIYDAGWGKLRDYVRYKAEGAGRRIVEVAPKGTSRECPECGIIKAKSITERVHSCECGCILDRDHAAALVILGRAVAGPGVGNVRQWPVRRLGNINTDNSVLSRYPGFNAQSDRSMCHSRL
jgi:putative transposase